MAVSIDTKYVTFVLLSHAAFVADEIWGVMLELARTGFLVVFFIHHVHFPARLAGGLCQGPF